jgi:hypothetical protein
VTESDLYLLSGNTDTRQVTIVIYLQSLHEPKEVLRMLKHLQDFAFKSTFLGADKNFQVGHVLKKDFLESIGQHDSDDEF